MEIFLLINGTKAGPYTVYEVCEELRSGKATPDTNAWIKGMAEWKPLRDLEPMRGLVELRIADAGSEEITVSDAERETLSGTVSSTIGGTVDSRPRPWVRFWARTLDLGLFTTMALYLIKVTGLGDPSTLADQSNNNLGILITIPVAWIFVEATLLYYFGTTPAKWLLKIRLRRTDGERLQLGQAYRRSVSVWWRGWGLGLFPVNILTFVISNMTLSTQGKTVWDQREDLEIEHRPIGEIAIVLAAAAILATSWATFHLIGMEEMLANSSKP